MLLMKKDRKRSLLKLWILSGFIRFLIPHSFSISDIFTSSNAAAAVSTGKVLCYTVVSGDNLWNIASRYSEGGEDVRKYVYDIKKLNHLESSIIHSNQTLKLPVNE